MINVKNCYIIVNKNDYKTTKHLVDNIIDYKIIDKILIVDNNSKEEEVKLLKTIKNEKIELYLNNKDLGYAGAINKGTKYLTEKYKNCNYIISNSDVVIMSEKDINSLLELLTYEKVGLVGPVILERGKRVRGRKIPTVNRDIKSNMFNKRDEDYSKTFYDDEVSQVEVISSAFFLVTSATLDKIGYLDDHSHLYYEDNILAFKIKKAGLMTLIDNKVVVKHLFSSTIENTMSSKEKFKDLYDSQVYFHTKYSKASPFKIALLKLSNRYRYNLYRLKRLIKKK